MHNGHRPSKKKVDSLESILTRFMARTDESMVRTDKAIARLERIVEHFVQEGARSREEAECERREINQRWGELAKKTGTVVEDTVAPSVRRLAPEVFECGGLVYFGMCQTVAREDDRSRRREFEALYLGTRAVLLNQTNTSPRSEDAREFVQFLRSGKFGKFYPQYSELPSVPAFSLLRGCVQN